MKQEANLIINGCTVALPTVPTAIALHPFFRPQTWKSEAGSLTTSSYLYGVHATLSQFITYRAQRTYARTRARSRPKKIIVSQGSLDSGGAESGFGVLGAVQVAGKGNCLQLLGQRHSTYNRCVLAYTYAVPKTTPANFEPAKA